MLSSVANIGAEINLHGPAIVGMDPAEVHLSSAAHDEQKSSQSTSDSMRAGTAAGITFGVTALAGLLIAVVVIGWRRHKSVKKDSSDLTEPFTSGYGAVSEGGNPQV